MYGSQVRDAGESWKGRKILQNKWVSIHSSIVPEADNMKSLFQIHLHSQGELVESMAKKSYREVINWAYSTLSCKVDITHFEICFVTVLKELKWL